MYGGHPLAQLAPSPAGLLTTSHAAVQAFRTRTLRTGGATLVLSGPLPGSRLLEAAEKAFAAVEHGGDVRVPAPAGPPPGGGTLRLRGEGARENALILGFAAVSRHDDRFAAAELANLVVGGYFSARLLRLLRQELGYAYSVRSTLTTDPLGPALAIATSVRAEVTEATVAAIHDDLVRLGRDGPAEREFEHARTHLLGTTKLRQATQQGATDLAFALARHGLPPHWLDDHHERLAQVTPEEVRDFVAAFLDPARAVAVVAGDGTDPR
ncbi:insulinase family protein [Nonomuraea sp. NBC_01738]|uniref:M16 family metallopeptidase n=1 Tax=Nonomuraea sp. NBC_01738 TaxID=2976003 RepID=UPI002E137C80|nr:insulinase family protein [Nonomuraea sp. NBC_01738]